MIVGDISRIASEVLKDMVAQPRELIRELLEERRKLASA